MRHGDKINNLGRKTAHRQSLMMNMAISLIEHKRIFTTLAKAKALRLYVEPLITKGLTDTQHNRRTVFAYLQNKDSIGILFKDIAEKVGDRKGGYTRIIKTGNRAGDAAEMAMIELVDFNEVYTNTKPTGETKKPKTRRSRAKKSASKSEGADNTAATEE